MKWKIYLLAVALINAVLLISFLPTIIRDLSCSYGCGYGHGWATAGAILILLWVNGVAVALPVLFWVIRAFSSVVRDLRVHNKFSGSNTDSEAEPQPNSALEVDSTQTGEATPNASKSRPVMWSDRAIALSVLGLIGCGLWLLSTLSDRADDRRNLDLAATRIMQTVANECGWEYIGAPQVVWVPKEFTYVTEGNGTWGFSTNIEITTNVNYQGTIATVTLGGGLLEGHSPYASDWVIRLDDQVTGRNLHERLCLLRT